MNLRTSPNKDGSMKGPPSWSGTNFKKVANPLKQSDELDYGGGTATLGQALGCQSCERLIFGMMRMENDTLEPFFAEDISGRLRHYPSGYTQYEDSSFLRRTMNDW